MKCARPHQHPDLIGLLLQPLRARHQVSRRLSILGVSGLSNLAEVKARQAAVIAVGTAGDEYVPTQCSDVLWVPDAPPLLQPLLTVLPLQMLGYALAAARGNDIDQPRNLAKSVTVE